ncbi:MAG: hypothetical protein V3W14_11255 [Candidatus Neomarinimicrobiota bacterium]
MMKIKNLSKYFIPLTLVTLLASVGGAGVSGTFRGPALDMSITTELPEFEFQEVEMLTGGYSPEYGNPQDAMINIASKEGSNSHHGIVRVTTEEALFSDWNGVEEPGSSNSLECPQARTWTNATENACAKAHRYVRLIY